MESLDSASKQFIMEVDTNINIESVILSDENKGKIAEFIREVEYRDKLIAHGLAPMNRMLFYGDSGCGKTYLGKALSNYLGYKMLYIDIATTLANGTVANNLKQIFDIARHQNAIIFLDEVDSIAWARDGSNEESGDVRRATNSLFQLIDQMPSNNIILCATNMLHRIDPAFKARFNMMLHFTRPKTNVKQALVKFVNSSFTVIDDVDNTTEGIVDRRSTLSYRELQFIVNRCMKTAVMNDTSEVRTSDMFSAVAVASGIQLGKYS